MHNKSKLITFLVAGVLLLVLPLFAQSFGNGPVRIIDLALLYVLFVWRAACFPLADRRNAVLLGVIMGAAYLTNYPAVVLPATLLLVLLPRRLLPPLPTTGHESPAGPAGPPLRPAPAGPADPRPEPTPAARPGGYLVAFGVAGLLVLPSL